MLYIDFYKTIAEADYRGEILYAGDVHPNELGYHYMYETARDVLRPACSHFTDKNKLLANIQTQYLCGFLTDI